MSTPQQPTKAPRRSARKQKQPNTYASDPKAGVSDNESSQFQDSTNDVEVANGNARARGKSHTNKKSITSNVTAGVHLSQTTYNAKQPEKSKGTPIKQAYAGPTFHQSPAASALPIPSFYSKSVPTVGSSQPSHAGNNGGAEQSDANLQQQASPTKRDTTPLDFLFEAARNARGTPRAESPSTRSANLSLTAESPVSRSPAPRDPDSVFPFELDGGSTPGEDGSSFATPYKERLEALTKTRSTSDGVQSMNEKERKAKTEALKKLLMHSQNQQTRGTGVDMHNPFNARAAQPQNHLDAPRPQGRHRSGPSTPVYMQNYPGSTPQQYFPNMSNLPYSGPHQIPTNRPPSSSLRNVCGAANDLEPAELSSDSPVISPMISTARRQGEDRTPRYAHGGQGSPQPPSKYSQPRPTRATPSAQQLEDDLRRVLKLDLTSRG